MWIRALIAVVLALLVITIAGCVFFGLGEDEPADPDDVIGMRASPTW
jgi:hypothetical protein